MAPAEVSLKSPRRILFDDESKSERMKEAQDKLEEQRLQSLLTMIAYKQKIARYYNQKVKARYFNIGDLVLRQAKSSQSPLANGKLRQNWEGPYKITTVIGNRAYRLSTLDDIALTNTWNASSLRRFYQ
ncbi:hypothetical protein M5689_003613 [Euphorbia peplus]|nr:hypothetical protein M5689_003613 [Euphorbia peplus]